MVTHCLSIYYIKFHFNNNNNNTDILISFYYYYCDWWLLYWYFNYNFYIHFIRFSSNNNNNDENFDKAFIFIYIWHFILFDSTIMTIKIDFILIYFWMIEFMNHKLIFCWIKILFLPQNNCNIKFDYFDW